MSTPRESEDFWIFGYGSLIWRPGFEFIERAPATVHGFHRALCVYSHVHRGTPEQPGLVLGLMRGGACRGVAYRAAGRERDATIRYLRQRELATLVYREAHVRARLSDGRTVAALAYVADTQHPQFAGQLQREERLRLVLQGRGQSGPNPPYVRHTHERLTELGIRDPELAWLVERLSVSVDP